MSRRRDEQRGDPPPPGTVLELQVDDVGSRGQGVGRTGSGLVVMVAGAVPGDLVRVRVERVHRNRVDARLESLVQPAPQRIEPRCAHFGRCGGCSLQTLEAGAQRDWKTRRLRQLVARQAGLSPVEVAAAREVGPAYGYRSRMNLTGELHAGRLVLGLHDTAGKLFRLEECHLPHPEIMEMLGVVRLALEGGGATVRGRFPFRLDLRRSVQAGRVLATVLWQDRPPAAVRKSLADLPGRHPRLELVQEGGGMRRQAGAGEIRDEIAGVPVGLDSRIFTQTHVPGATELARAALAWLIPAAPGELLELYAGTGVLSRAAGSHFSGAVAVETSAAAVRLGRRLAAGGPPLTFLRQEARTAVAGLARAGRRFAAGALNPPRSGLHASLPSLLSEMGIQRLAYVSCHPGSLVRDLARLQECGFQVVGLEPFDLFPQTAEIEVLGRLQARETRPVDEPRRPL